MRVAFHKGGNLIGDRLIKWWDGGIYSHCEIVFDDGLWTSASFMDGKKVRGKLIAPTPGSWDYITIPKAYEQVARDFFYATEGAPYDVLGLLRFVIAPYKGRGKRYWCSEWVAEALDLREPWRYGPNGLYNVLCTLKEEEAA